MLYRRIADDGELFSVAIREKKDKSYIKQQHQTTTSNNNNNNNKPANKWHLLSLYCHTEE